MGGHSLRHDCPHCAALPLHLGHAAAHQDCCGYPQGMPFDNVVFLLWVSNQASKVAKAYNNAYLSHSLPVVSVAVPAVEILTWVFICSMTLHTYCALHGVCTCVACMKRPTHCVRIESGNQLFLHCMLCVMQAALCSAVPPSHAGSLLVACFPYLSTSICLVSSLTDAMLHPVCDAGLCTDDPSTAVTWLCTAVTW